MQHQCFENIHARIQYTVEFVQLIGNNQKMFSDEVSVGISLFAAKRFLWFQSLFWADLRESIKSPLWPIGTNVSRRKLKLTKEAVGCHS